MAKNKKAKGNAKRAAAKRKAKAPVKAKRAARVAKKVARRTKAVAPAMSAEDKAHQALQDAIDAGTSQTPSGVLDALTSDIDDTYNPESDDPNDGADRFDV